MKNYLLLALLVCAGCNEPLNKQNLSFKNLQLVNSNLFFIQQINDSQNSQPKYIIGDRLTKQKFIVELYHWDTIRNIRPINETEDSSK